jgi:hypothetical protein
MQYIIGMESVSCIWLKLIMCVFTVLDHQQGQLSLNDLRHEHGFNDLGSNIRSSHIENHKTPTFIASASQSSNQQNLPHIDRQHFDINSQNSLHNNFQNQKPLL